MAMIDTSLWQLFLKGGFFMWPLLALSLVSISIIIERIFFFFLRSYNFSKTLDSSSHLSPSSTLDKGKGNPLITVILAYSSDLENGEEHCLNVGSREASHQVVIHERGLRVLATIGMISPLIGLLGTVWGMVQAFAVMASEGANVTTADFADGIWTGLLTTVAGLIVAIPAVTASKIFEGRVERLTHDLNTLASHLKERYFPAIPSKSDSDKD